jgi:hypothetical protein
VAVVEELCSLLTATPDVELLLPALKDILLRADGSIALRQGTSGERGASGAGRILRALLATADVPAPLRLFVIQSTRGEAYATIRAFAEALAYFCKPGRAELIRALYERCVARPAAAVPVTTPPVEAQADEPRETKPSPRLRLRRPVHAWVASGVAVAVLVATAIWFWPTRADPASASSRPTLIAQTKSAIEKLGTEVREVFTSTAAPSVPAGDSAATEAPVSSKPPRRASLPPRAGDLGSPATAADIAQLDTPQSTPAPIPDDPEPTVDSHPDAVEGRTPRGGPAAIYSSPAAIYSSTDADVQPPVLVYPQLPAPIVLSKDADAVNRMELVVSESGTVERVRLVAGPRRMPDMMLLSGAKMWRFSPALKDGQPVRYRTVLTWVGAP